MATRKTVPGLSFKLTVEPLINGEPYTEVDPICFVWDQSVIADNWHEKHADLAVHSACRDLKQRVVKLVTRKKR